MAFFPGLGYSELRDLPLPELSRLHVEARRIHSAREREVARAKSRAR